MPSWLIIKDKLCAAFLELREEQGMLSENNNGKC